MTRPSGLLGRLAPTRPYGVGTLATYAVGRLPAPPASVDVPKATYAMDGNDRLGDCTIAGAAHLVAAWDAEVGASDPVPSEDEVVTTYEALTGGKDTGLNEHAVVEHWRQAGLWGRSIDGYVPLEPTNLVELHQAIALYGGAYLGVVLPSSAEQQFQAEQPWTVQPGASILGGHCIVALGYTPSTLLCATWGGIVEVTYPWCARYLEEAWCILPSAFVEAGHGPTLALPALRKDLDLLAA